MAIFSLDHYSKEDKNKTKKVNKRNEQQNYLMTSEQTSFSDKDHEMRLKSLEKTSKWS